MLKAVNLHKSFGKKAIVRGVTIQVEPGRVVGLLGPNGAGKTTCFYMIVGLISVGKGKILVDEADVTHEPVNVRAGLGVDVLRTRGVRQEKNGAEIDGRPRHRASC